MSSNKPLSPKKAEEHKGDISTGGFWRTGKRFRKEKEKEEGVMKESQCRERINIK